MSLIETRPAGLTPMEILSNAVDGGADVATLEKLLDLQERWERNQARKAFEEAMAAAKEELPTITKNRHVGYDSKKADAGRTEYSHEDFAQIDKAVKPVLSRHGLSYRFRTASPPEQPITVTCIIAHKMGYSEENSLQGPRDTSGSKNGIQAIGSTVTYLQRYTLKAALGLAVSSDDDGGSSENGELITTDQLGELRKRIAAFGDDFDIARFCSYLRIDALPDLQQKNYQSALDALAAKAKVRS